MKKNEYYEERGLDRIISLSDAVFAFSLTLLAMDLVVPTSQGFQDSVLLQGLMDDYTRFIYFLLTFVIIGAYWFSHHRIFRFIRRYDGILMRLNMFFLFFIIIMPFTTKLLNLSGHAQIAVVIAAIGYSAPGFLLSIIWHYASQGKKFIDETISPEFARLTVIKNYISPTVFLISIPISFIKPSYALYFWLTLFPIQFFVNHRYPDIVEDD